MAVKVLRNCIKLRVLDQDWGGKLPCSFLAMLPARETERNWASKVVKQNTAAEVNFIAGL